MERFTLVRAIFYKVECWTNLLELYVETATELPKPICLLENIPNPVSVNLADIIVRTEILTF